MTTAGLSVRVWNDTPIQRRNDDGYVNATAMCQANGKRWAKYAESDRCQSYLDALAKRSGIRTFDLIQAQSGRGGGTWVHPTLAIDLARWISPDFAVWMDGWFLEHLNGNHLPANQVTRQEFEQLKARTHSNSSRLLSLAVTLEAQDLLDFDAWAAPRNNSIPTIKPAHCLPPAWPCTTEQLARAAVRLVATARSKDLDLISARDVLRWRPFGRRHMTARQARQFLCQVAKQYGVGVMVPGKRNGKEQLLLAA